MMIFIKNIPANTLPRELTDFVSSELKDEPIFSSGVDLIPEIFALQNQETQILEFHGLVNIKPEVACSNEDVQELTEKRFNDSVAMLRDYNHRASENERRKNHNSLVEVSFNKRSAERRRGCYLKNIENLPVINSAKTSNVYII